MSNKENEKNTKIIRIVILVAIVLMLALVIFYAIYLNCNKPKIGNTMGNIKNYGYVAEDENYIYYFSPSEDGKYKTINKIDKEFQNKPTQLIAGEWDISGINVYKGNLYFITMLQTNNKNDLIDNKVHKMRTDGTNDKVIIDNKFHNASYEIYVVRDRIYYIGEDQNIYYTDLDGKNTVKINDNKQGFIGVTENYIFYNKKMRDDKIKTFYSDLDGKNEKEINGDNLFYPNLVGEKVYYTDEYLHIYETNLGNYDSKLISKSISYALNADESGIYFLRYVDEGKQILYKLDFTDGKAKKLKNLESESFFLGLTKDWVIHIDTIGTKGIVSAVSKDGKKTQILSSVDFNEVLENKKEEVSK